jgi:hypothetical protein
MARTAAPNRSGWCYSRIFQCEFQLVRERNELKQKHEDEQQRIS